jgi:hypothetical protein
MNLKQRAQNNEFSYIRALNLKQFAEQAHRNKDMDTLLNFKVEGQPLASFLNFELNIPEINVNELW